MRLLEGSKRGVCITRVRKLSKGQGVVCPTKRRGMSKLQTDSLRTNRLTIKDISVPLIDEGINETPLLLFPDQGDDRTLALVLLGHHPDAFSILQGIRRGVLDLGTESDGPTGNEESQGVAKSEQDGVDERPFFRLDPVIVAVVVGVVKQGVESCIG